MSNKLNIEDLFRSTLDEPVIPSPGTWEKTARALNRKRFWRFDPRRLNIFYVGLTVSALSLLVINYSARDEFAGHHTISDSGSYQDRNDTGNPAAGINASLDTEIIAVEKNIGDRPKTINSRKTKEKNTAFIVENQANAIQSTVDFDSVDITTYTIPNRPTAIFTPVSDTGCAPLTVKMNSYSQNAASFFWTFGNNTTDTTENPTVIYTEAGTYLVTLTVFNKTGDAATVKHLIEVLPAPVVDFELSENEENLQIMNYSEGAVAYEWTMSIDESKEQSISNQLQPEVLTKRIIFSATNIKTYNTEHQVSIKLKTTAINGCSSEAVRTIQLVKKAPLTFPNAFSPNPTGPVSGSWSLSYKENYIFHPVFELAPKSFSIKIFNRSGELVFESHDVMFGWNGYYRDSPAAAGVYIYRCEGLDNYGESYYLQGDVTVIKY